MEFEQARAFMETNHRGVITTMQRNGAMQDSIVVCGSYQGNSAKVRNLRRDPRCTVMAVDTNWRGYVVVEGQARLYDYHNTDHEELRQMLREVYRACGGDHPDWEEYDRAMVEQDAVVALVSPERVYGQLR